jgi:predicted amidohydrolase
METLTVGLWATNLEQPMPSLPAWIDAVGRRLEEARAAGAGLLVLPELACMQWLAFGPADPPPAVAVDWLASVAAEAAPQLRAMAGASGVAVLAGSFSVRGPAGERPRNQAWLFLPDGRLAIQDKLYLTPSEEDTFAPGAEINVLHWAGLRLAIVVCLDVEVTALWARLGRLDLDLVLVPAKTDLVSGFHRVFGCARARAIELQAPVCVVGAVGMPLAHPALDTGMGGAAVYLPCESALGPTGRTGIAGGFGPVAAASGASPLLICPEVPVLACRRIRHGAAEAEVWPGSWPAHRLTIRDPTPLH